MSERPSGVIEREVSSWPGVTVGETGRDVGTQFGYGKIELGHLHGDSVAHLPFPKKVRNELITKGRAEVHPPLPDSGWVQRRIDGDGDVEAAIELFRLNYDRARERDARWMDGWIAVNRPKIGIITGSTREGRFGEVPAAWFYEIASERDDMEFEVVDLRDYPLPFYGETPPDDDAISRWREKMESLDGYVFITAEYNHSITGVLKNALDHLGPEVHRKPAAFVGYGGVGGARAVQQLRLILLELQMASIRHAVHIGTVPMLGVKREEKDLSDYDFLVESADATLDELSWWTHALKAGREEMIGALQ